MERSERQGKGSQDDSANVQFWDNPGWLCHDSIAYMEN